MINKYRFSNISKYFPKSRPAIFTIVFILMGITFVLITKAATLAFSIEPESGQKSVSIEVTPDTTSSNGNSIKFSINNGYNPVDALGLPKFLDRTTNYSPPESGAVFVSLTGNDSDNGTLNNPYKTICKAISSVQAGGTIVLRGGVYREGYDNISNSGCTYKIFKQITIQPYGTERAWIKGSKLVSNWTSTNGKWSVSWPALANQASQVPAGNEDAIIPGSLAGDSAMVFINGVSLSQVGSLAEVNASSFYANRTTNTIYIGDNPSGKVVEVSEYPRSLTLFSLQGGDAGGSTIKGIGFAHFASTWDPSSSPGALIATTNNITIDNTVFASNSAGGLFLGNPGVILKNSLLTNNGANGASGNLTHNSIIDGNVFSNNNKAGFAISGQGCAKSCAIAGMKVAHSDNLTVKGNTFEGNNGTGFWCDLNCVNATVVNNVSRNNKSHGIYYEVSDGGIIASNLLSKNNGYGLINGSANVKIYNNTIFDNDNGVLIYDDDRVPQASEIGPNTSNVSFVNNLLVNNVKMLQVHGYGGSQTGPNNYFSDFDYNGYFRTNGLPSELVQWMLTTGNSSYSSLNAFKSARNWDVNGVDTITTAASPFRYYENKDYRIATDSSFYNNGRPLPADVAAAIGVTAGQAIDRGAVIK